MARSSRRPRLRQRRLTGYHDRQRRLGQHQAHAAPRKCPGIQPVALPLPQPGRALLQQAQAFQSSRNTLRKARRQLPRARQNRRSPDLDAVYESVT